MRKALFATLFFSVLAIFSHAQQQQTPPAPPQSPRQALIEIANGQVEKHLTVEVQQLLKQPENKQALQILQLASPLKSQMGNNVEMFESGPVLLSMKEPGQAQRKIEVHVDNDDMSGDQDTLELSVHSFHDGIEQEEEWQALVSHFTVTMVRQQNIWRLNKIGVGVEVAIGDPEFVKKRLHPGLVEGNASSAGVYTTFGKSETMQTPELVPNQLMMMGFAEQSFAHQHTDVGFTCSLQELSEFSAIYGIKDPQMASGNYKGYKITLTGCEGKPAGTFQLALEPLPGKGGKAYCVDATQNIRVSDDGRASTCFTAGRPEQLTPDPVDSVGVDLHVAEPASKPKD